MGSQHFRAGVVIVIRHPDDGRVMAFERSDSPDSWQLPQGGLELGEEPIDAAWRELHEETGLTSADVRLVGEHPHWVAYEWPADVREQGKDGKRRGQVQRWYFFEPTTSAVAPTPDGSEFVAWRWIDPAALLESVLSWRRNAYEQVLRARE